jgi:hypothetical protein
VESNSVVLIRFTAIFTLFLLIACGGLGKPIPSPVSATETTLKPEISSSALGTNRDEQGYAWPDWARKARIAGVSFEPGDPWEDIESTLDHLAAQNVNVILADSPWGWSYSAWVDDSEFYQVRDLVAKMVEAAHQRNLKVVMYQTGLELTSEPQRNPGDEHPDWLQISLDGQPILFNDISSGEEHWLDKGQWDAWLSPCSGYRQLSLERVRQVAASGVDGLWVDTVYLQHSIGSHEDLWPSTDPCSVAAFQAATGLNVPTAEDWDDPTWRRWVIWRYTQTVEYLTAYKDAARQVNPNLVFFEENWNVDTSGATQYANDPANFLPYADIATGHEVSTIADRVDEGQTGMKNASLDQWLSFRTMIAFARAADRGKPSWILTYGYQPRDSAQLAGMCLAEATNFYETLGPVMDGTVGEAFRTQLFGWIAAHEDALYDSQSAAQVGLVFSPRNRDLLDSGSGNLYDMEDSTHFAAYRMAANLLYRAHIPFDVVLESDLNQFAHYAVLILPEVQLMSDETADALRAYPGDLLVVGDTGWYDEWFNERSQNALEEIDQQYFSQVDNALIEAADTALLNTTAPAEIQIGLRRTTNGYAVVLVNVASTPAEAFTFDLQLSPGERITAAHLSTLQGNEMNLTFSVDQEVQRVRVQVPAVIDTLALVTLTSNRNLVFLPIVQN